MVKQHRDDEDAAIADLLFGDGKPQIKDLANPTKRKQALRVAKMLGIEVRREQLMRIWIGAAIVLVVLLIGLWAIAKVLGALFWAPLVVGVGAVGYKMFGGRASPPKQVAESQRPAIAANQRDMETAEREADRKADEALAELEKRLKP